MAVTMASLEPILKEIYEGSLEHQLNDDTTAFSRIDKSGQGVGTKPNGGKYVNFPLHVSRNSGIGARREGEALPNAGKQGYVEAFIGLKNQYAGIEINGQIFAQATKQYQTFANAVEEEMSRIKVDLSKDRNRQYFGDGSGKIAKVVSVSGQNIVLDSLQHIQDEEVVDIVVAADGTNHGAALRIAGIDDDTNTVTVVGTISGAVAGDILVRQGSWDREWGGLAKMIGDQPLYDLDPANARIWKSHLDDQGGTPTDISDLTMTRMTDRIRLSGGKTTVILTTFGLRRSYWQFLSQNKRFVNTESYKGGVKDVTFEGPDGPIPMVADIDAPAGEMQFVNEKVITLYRDNPFKFMDRDGSMWKQKVDQNGRYDAYLATLFEYSELGTRRRNTHGRISNFKEDPSK